MILSLALKLLSDKETIILTTEKRDLTMLRLKIVSILLAHRFIYNNSSSLSLLSMFTTNNKNYFSKMI